MYQTLGETNMYMRAKEIPMADRGVVTHLGLTRMKVPQKRVLKLGIILKCGLKE